MKIPTEQQVRKLATQIGFQLSTEEIVPVLEQLQSSQTSRKQYDEFLSNKAEHYNLIDLEYTGPTQGIDPYNAILTTCTLTGESGPLDGVEFVLKDNIAVAGVPMTCGSTAFNSVIPSEHAPVTSRLLAAGGTITGKANMDELAYYPTGESSDYGACRNPTDQSRVTGGSSAGSAAAVAAGLVDAALGTDTGGSVRIPAALCGVVGFKPTWGAVPTWGVYPLAPMFDTVGPLTTDVATARRVFSAIQTGPGLKSHLPVDGNELGQTTKHESTEPVIGVPDWDAWKHVDSRIRERFTEVVGQFETAGATVCELPLPPVSVSQVALNDLVAPSLALGLDMPALSTGCFDRETQAVLNRILSNGHGFGSFIRTKAIEGQYILEYLPESYAAAWRAVLRLQSIYSTTFTNCDLLLTPTTPIVAPRRDESFSLSDFAMFTRTANLLGGPALSVPMKKTELPSGLQIMGSPGTDSTVLAIGELFESIRDTP